MTFKIFILIFFLIFGFVAGYFARSCSEDLNCKNGICPISEEWKNS